MPNQTHAVSVAEHAGTTTSEQDGLGGAVSETTGFEEELALNVDVDTGWKAATANANDTRRQQTLPTVKPIAAIGVAVDGMGGNDDPDAALRIRWDEELMEKPAAPLVPGDTPDGGITETASFSWILFERMDPLKLEEDTALAEIRTTGASNDTTRLVQLLVGPSGQLRVNFPRMSGSSNFTNTTGQLDDLLPHWIEIHGTDNGSGSDLSILMDGIEVGTLSTAVTFASQPATGVRLVSSSNHYLGGMWFFDDVLSAAQATRYRYSLRAGTELNLVVALNLEETSGTTGADSTTNNQDMTFGANSGWATITNPRPSHSAEPAARHQPWRQRALYAAHLNGALTPAALDTSPTVSHWFWYQSKGGAAATASAFSYFGTAVTGGNSDYRFSVTPAGGIRVAVDRFSGSPTLLNTGDVSDGQPHRITFFIAWGVASIGVDGVPVDSSSSIPAFVANTVSRYELVASTSHSAEIGGPVGIASRPYTHAEMDAFLTGQAHAIPTPSTSPGLAGFWPLNEGAGTTAANHGTEPSSSDLTVTAADWLPGAMDNPLPGPYRDATQKLNLMWLEIAPGTSPLCGTILLEFFTTSGEAPLVLSILAFEVKWPTTQGASAGTDTSEGPALKRGAGGGIFPSAVVPGRRISYTFPKLDFAEETAIRMAVDRSSQPWRGDALVATTPTLLIERVSDRNFWFESSAVVQALPSDVQFLSPEHGQDLRRGLVISGIEIFFNE